MKRKILYWQLSALVFAAVGGTFLHFLYTLTGKSVLASPFSGVNESTWEHMKLLYFPLFAFALIQRRFFKEFKGFWCIKVIGISTGLILIAEGSRTLVGFKGDFRPYLRYFPL